MLPLLLSVDFPFYSPLLTWKPSFGVMRPCPPWSKVACKLTSPFSSPPCPLPIPNSQHPRSTVRFTKTTLRFRLLLVRNNNKPLRWEKSATSVHQYISTPHINSAIIHCCKGSITELSMALYCTSHFCFPPSLPTFCLILISITLHKHGAVQY